MQIRFLGAAQTVTGSQHLLEINGRQVLLDCGLYQGHRKEAEIRNRTFLFEPGDLDALGQLGILYAENGLTSEGLEQFQKMLAADKKNATALNNIGNISFLQGRMEDAKLAYESALAATPDDAGIMVNLARVFSRMGKTEEAKKLFQQAAAVNPRLTKQYQDVGAAVGIGK